MPENVCKVNGVRPEGPKMKVGRAEAAHSLGAEVVKSVEGIDRRAERQDLRSYASAC